MVPTTRCSVGIHRIGCQLMFRTPCDAMVVLWKRRYAQYMLILRVFGSWNPEEMTPPESWTLKYELCAGQKGCESWKTCLYKQITHFAIFLVYMELVSSPSVFWWDHFALIPSSKYPGIQQVVSIPTLPEAIIALHGLLNINWHPVWCIPTLQRLVGTV